MATERNLCGFEIGSLTELDSTSGSAALVHDATLARSGEWFLRIAPTAGTGTARMSSDGIVFNAAFAGTRTRSNSRVFVRINALPDAGKNPKVISWETRYEVRIDHSGQVTVGSLSGVFQNVAVLTAGSAWHEFVFETDEPAGSPTTVSVKLTIDGGATATATQVIAGPGSMPEFVFGEGVTNATYSFDFDDCVWFGANGTDGSIAPGVIGSSVTLPTRTHVLPVPVAQQGSINQWSGTFASVLDVPPNASPDTYQASTTPGQVTTWQKDFHEWNDLSGDVQGVKVYAWVRHNGAGTKDVDILFNAAVVGNHTLYPTIPGAYPVANAIRGGFDWSTYSLTGFDSAEIGIRLNGTCEARVGAIFLEVLTDVAATPSAVFNSISPTSGPIAGGTTVIFTGKFSRKTNGITFDGSGNSSVFIITSIVPTQIIGTTVSHPAGLCDVRLLGTTVMTGAYTYVSPVDTIVFSLPAARRDPAITIERQLNDQPSTFTFDSTDEVDGGTPIQINSTDGVTPIVRGVIVRTVETVEDSRHNAKYSATGTDRQYYLNKKLVSGRFENIAADTVIKQILSSFAPDFSPSGVASGLPAITVAFYRDCTVGQALTKIMGLISGHWYLALDNSIHAYVGTEIRTNPAAITDTDSSMLLDPPIQITRDRSQLRNRVYVRGRGSASSLGVDAPVNPHAFNLPTEFDIINLGTGGNTIPAQFGYYFDYGGYYLTADGGHTTWAEASTRRYQPLAGGPGTYPNAANYTGSFPGAGFSSVTLIDLTAQIRVLNYKDSRVTAFRLFRRLQVGGENGVEQWYFVADVPINYKDPLNLGYAEYLDNTKDTDLIASGPTLPDPSTSVDTSANVYTMREDVPAQVAAAAIEGGDGIHEFQIVDTTLQTLAAANQRADAELALFANPIVTVEYSTRDEASVPGSFVHFNLTNPVLVGDFKIQSVTIDQIHENGSLVPRYRVTASSVRFTLEDLMRRVLIDQTGGSGGGSGGDNSTSTGGGGASGHATSADTLYTARKINGQLFDGSVDIQIPMPISMFDYHEDELPLTVPGQRGADGAAGTNGAAGATGATGAAGPAGFGLPGLDGLDGEWGFPGPQGPAGTNGATGKVVQVVATETGAVATGTTVIPFDDTIPQNTEGTEFMTLAVTPTSSSNKLKIVVTFFATVTGTPWITGALFQDSTANALAVGASFNNLSTAGMMVTFTHYMTAGTTSSTTFKVRIGPSSSATVTFNGQSGGRLFGGVAASSIVIEEIIP